ncbi:MAG: hypothetical protein ACTSRG_13415 [Candidatus Helarchaeota archaeon]
MTQDAGALMKVLAGILEDAVRALQRIEKKIGDQTKMYNELTERITKIEKIIDDNITILAQKEIPNLEKTLTQKINDLGLQNLDHIDSSLDQTIMKLQKSIQILSIQNLVSRIENLASIRSAIPQKVKSASPKKELAKKQVVKESSTKKQTVKAGTSPPPQTQPAEEKKKEEKKEDDESLIKPSSFFGS